MVNGPRYEANFNISFYFLRHPPTKNKYQSSIWGRPYFSLIWGCVDPTLKIWSRVGDPDPKKKLGSTPIIEVVLFSLVSGRPLFCIWGWVTPPNWPSSGRPLHKLGFGRLPTLVCNNITSFNKIF